MKIDSESVRAYLLKAISANLNPLKDVIKQFHWRSGYFNKVALPDSTEVPKVKKTLVNVFSDIDELTFEEIPNSKYSNLQDFKKSLQNVKNSLSQHKNSILEVEKIYLSHAKKRAQVNKAASPTEIPEPIESAKAILDKYLKVFDTALAMKDLQSMNLELNEENKLSLLKNILIKFDSIARGVNADRRKGKKGYSFKDEYDVQDFLYGLLFILFDDIRKEEPTPSLASIKSRCDLFIPEIGLFIEIKSTLKKSKNSIPKELAADTTAYLSSEKCRNLIFFIYDPNKKISNKQSLKDLENSRFKNKLAKPTVIVCPS